MEYHDLVVSRRMLLEELQRSNRQLREANRVKSAFIEVASHELNTPVSVVLGLTELWKLTQAENSDEITRSWIERIHAAGKRLAATVSRMLKLLQADQLGSPLSVKETDLAALVSDVVRDLAPFLEIRQQAVRIVLPGTLEPLQIDAEKIADVLTNLLTNAIKFTPDGKEITVRVDPVSPDSLRIAVEDPGVGIRPEDREHLFQPFFTGFDTLHHSSGQFQYGKRGIGLGLMLIKTFVELHGGQVEEVRSEPDRGSVFSFVLPREPKQRPARPRAAAHEAEPEPQPPPIASP
jgi:signal transduction histidine kinase